MKTVRIEDDIHGKLTSLVGELTAESGKLQTYADALTKLVNTSIILPDETIAEINEAIKKRKDLGYTTPADFVRDAVRRRLEELRDEEFYVNVPVPRNEYELLNEAIEVTKVPFKNADDYIRQHIREKNTEYEQFKDK